MTSRFKRPNKRFRLWSTWRMIHVYNLVCCSLLAQTRRSKTYVFSSQSITWATCAGKPVTSNLNYIISHHSLNALPFEIQTPSKALRHFQRIPKKLVQPFKSSVILKKKKRHTKISLYILYIAISTFDQGNNYLYLKNNLDVKMVHPFLSMFIKFSFSFSLILSLFLPLKLFFSILVANPYDEYMNRKLFGQ